MEFQRTGHYDLMYMKTKELAWKETQGIQNIGIKDSKGNRTVEQSQVPKIWENNITELYDRPNRLEILKVEPLQSEVEKAIKEMRNKKATDDDDVPGDVLKLLGEGGLKIMMKLINTIYETGEWSKDFTKVTMIASKKPRTTKCSDHCAISLIAHSAKMLAKILRRNFMKVTLQFTCKMGTGSFPEVRCGWGVALTPHSLLVPRSKIEYLYLYSP